SKNVSTEIFLNNIWARNKYFDESKPTIFLNSHHDTVKPNKGYTLDPFSPIEKENKLFGLGSNDAGGSLVSLVAVFLYFYESENLKYNLLLAATAEEEISGKNGVEALLMQKDFAEALGVSKAPLQGRGACGIVGEPTQMQMAVAERGLLVIDCIAEGKAGHAAREEGENAIYKAMKDIEWFQSYKFLKISELLGSNKMTVTSIETENKQHNVTPPLCSFVVDVRVNELYTFEEVLDTIQQNVISKVRPRSTRLRSSSISLDHPLVKAGLSLNRSYYGSPTTSDKALMPFPTLKIGPGDSARSHIADEFIYLDEIKEGIEIYIQLLQQIL
ncbi:MAG TPA: M20/M25/M40 family metallo-hydrolase, partial [Chitinophagaceae bacterium]|nr:M20/M25/M40 family metallo-hydrolase [Chitinophagaceae bacterium]